VTAPETGRHATVTPAERWRRLLEARAIPEHVLAAAPADPHRQPPERFAAPEVPDDTPSRRAGLALLEPAGTVLDVGCGAGAASLALCPPATHVTGLDDATDMLAAFTRACLERDVPWQAVLGTWPGAAADAGRADVVLAHHVVYNAPDLDAFVAALDAAALRGVVMELTDQHPLAWLDPLWRRFHGVERPPPPTADDALAVITDVLGVAPTVTRWTGERPRGTRIPGGERLGLLCQRLCLPESRADEVADAVAELGPARSEKVTVSWPTGRS
jgi:SAM-dependent methyltransferase